MLPLEQTTQQKANAFRDAGVTIPAIPVADIAKPVTPIVPPVANTQITPTPFDPTQIISDSQKYVQSFETPNESKLNNVEGLLKQIGIPSRAETRKTKETELGLPALRKTVNDLTSQLYTQKAQYENVPQQVNDVYSASDALQSFLDTRTTSVQNRIASQQRLTAASLMAAQGNLTAAQSLADQSVDDEFFDIEQQQKQLKDQRQFLVDAVARDEVKLTKAQTLALKKAEREQQINDIKLADAKEERKSVLSIMNTLAQYGVDPAIRNKVAQAKTVEEAYALAGSSITDPRLKYELEGLRLDSILKRVSIANVQDQIRSRRQEDDNKKANGGLTPAEAKEARKQQKEMTVAKQAAYSVAEDTKNLASSLLGRMKTGQGNSIVGKTRLFTAGYAVPGTEAANLQTDYNTLKDTLALGNIDKLKGAMSDKDIEFLRNTAAAISLSQSEDAFTSGLEKIVNRMNAKLQSNIEANFTADELQGVDKFFSAQQQVVPNFNPNDY